MSVRDRLVVTAIDLIRRQGVAATGLSQLLERSGAARRSLYLNFPGGKAELVADATVTAGKTLADGIDLLFAEQGPVGTLRAFVAMWIANLTSSDFEVGCPILAAALGRSEAPAAADAAGQVFLDWEQRIATGLETAGLSTEDAERQATLTVAAIEGAIVMSQATKSERPLRRVEEALVESVEQLLKNG
ncbi:TetR/AcrR family transcriptional regulator [Mycolicibacterium aubagnense]|uniref:TetR-family transcriptional regulator n=1 Tax=Mycolicibacterium aubagnense TaxID=319707 RepID=A0ABM7ICX6_9MYCO|nr:TetR family transcriptional regulator [Mycolicibacterium aubagnense]TLH50196.1 TetR/AcrR family transcriptional regulator [Mycolicibacterium aubagnense]WGI33622.1 TetR family transcriptional regulator [Mycolicibacterium aubagnense]BBX84633.1 putative TetR-family transcriptional regulator [Mycolicibacterium aubagnense]